MNDYSNFYKTITGFAPYQYQLKVAELLLSGKNIILTVPTGAGKTWASIMPFLYAQQSSKSDFPMKMIYSLPLRTLANSIYYSVSEVLEENKIFKGTPAIHTGEYKNDEHFENDIIFSTIDQTLSNFLCFPLSLSKRQANINAGALIGSYLVFDEFHLLDPKLSMATTIGMLKTLKNLCRFCIMTATLSGKYIKNLKCEVNAEVVSIDDFPEDVIKINSMKIPEGYEAKKSVIVKDETINVSSILKQHQKKTIVICNRVEKAQQLYNEIVDSDLKGFQNLSGLDKTNIICLHSRFFDEDRKKKEEEINQLFGKENEESAILISTQVIEAGMDISCDTMHVEISPINSFLQRAGRCARWEGEYGEIYVYNTLEMDEKEILKLETDKKEELNQIRAINNKYLPYDKLLCEITFEKLKGISKLDKDISQRLVDEILTSKELNDYSLIKQDNFNRSKIQQSWETCEKNMYSQTIRDIQSIEVAIIDYSQERQGAFMPFKYQTIGLYKWSFIKWAKEILNERDFDIDDDVIFIAIKNTESSFIDFDTNDLDSYSLEVVRSIEPLKNCYDTVFVDKSIFKYTSGAGLELGEGTTSSPLKPNVKKEKEITVYRKDTFLQHNKAIIGCYEQEFKPKLRFAFQQLDTYWGENIDWDKLIKAMICLHDYGKLNSAWQKPMRELQKLKGNYEPGEVLAHSDFNQLTDKEIEKQSGAKNKPPHAGAGAYATLEILGNYFNDKRKIKNILFPIATAILKHHSPETISFSDYKIEKTEFDVFISLWDTEVNIPFNFQTCLLQMKEMPIDRYLINSRADDIGIVFYFFLVRILRICDQKATQTMETYLN
ncbi:MAG: CRISPR-associated helicase Cas3' [Paludibacteraceae bacterium]|nr:CRISPR-associated helicase Cas3' [Paludibacteraceae bacterium]